MPRKKSQNKNSGYKDKLFRIDAELAADLESIAEEQGTSSTETIPRQTVHERKGERTSQRVDRDASCRECSVGKKAECQIEPAPLQYGN